MTLWQKYNGKSYRHTIIQPETDSVIFLSGDARL